MPLMNDPAPLPSFPGLAELEPDARARFARAVQRVRLPAQSVVFRPGDVCDRFLFVLAGRVRVQQIAESGREIVLYRVGPGETCVLTTASLLGGDPYAAEGVTDDEVEALVLPLAGFQDLLATSDAFRRLVFRTYGRRLTQIMAVLEDVAFRRIDARLAAHLLARAGAASEVLATHHDLAVELGTAREVVSRQLKAFEQRGLVQATRGSVRILERAGLAALAERVT